MTATYNLALVSDKDQVRFLIGDTKAAYQFQDEEISFMLRRAGNIDLAAIGACRVLAAKYSSKADTTIETVSVSHSQKAIAFNALADRLQSTYDRSGVGSSGMTATGIGISETDSVYADSDRLIDPVIQGMFDNPQFSNRRGFPPQTVKVY